MTSTPPDEHVVRLEFPPSARFLSAARLVAASMGADAGLTVDDLEDLRLGVNELVIALVESSGRPSRIALEFVTDDGSITVSGRIDGAVETAAPDDLTARILSAVVDHYELGPSSFVLTKASSLRERS